MNYHLDTIPVWEAVEQKSACCICLLQQKCETDELDRALGGSVMEPDERIRVNEKGICARHHAQLFEAKNRLGHALMTDTHSIEMVQKLHKLKDGLSPSGRFFGKKTALDGAVQQLHSMNTSCVICEEIEQHMKRYLFTFIHLWKKDAKFPSAVQAGGLCLPHCEDLLKMAQESLSEAEQIRFAHFVLELVLRDLEQNEQDLKWFTLKFDYRNQDKPWGNSKDALERTITQLRGRFR